MRQKKLIPGNGKISNDFVIIPSRPSSDLQKLHCGEPQELDSRVLLLSYGLKIIDVLLF